jgi:Tol biopolymer transport system component
MSENNRSHVRLLPSVLALGLVAGVTATAGERVFVDQWSPTRSELFIAETDGSKPRKLVPGLHIDYNASFSFDGQWVVFTSERYGSADVFRVRASGMDLERLTDDPAFDDQAALSPDGRSIAFVSTRGGESTDIYLLDLQTRKVRNLTKGPGGDFRPSWSPDGRRIAFSSDRGTKVQAAPGTWEQVHAASVYVMSADGSGVRKLSGEGQLAGSPKWSDDGTRLVFYEVAVRDTFAARQLPDQPNVESRIVSIDVATGARQEHAAGRGLKLSPQFLGPDRIAYLVKNGPSAALTFTSGERGITGDIGNPAWTRDGKQVVYHSGPIATIPQPRAPGQRLVGRDPRFDLLFASGFPAASPDGTRLVVSERTGRGNSDDRTALVVWHTDGSNPRRIFRAEGSVMGPHWSPDGRQIVFGAGSYFLARKGRPAQIVIVGADGSNPRTIPTGPGNAGFPSWSADGTEVVYRYWEDTAGGLRAVNVASGAIRTMTTGYDNFPMWSPKGDLIAFSRLADGNFDIYTVRPDGTGLRRLTDDPGNDSHPAWSPDGKYILFSSSRGGFKDEAPLFDIPQPYGELFVMKADGSDQTALTDNKWEEGTPTWVGGKKHEDGN